MGEDGKNISDDMSSLLHAAEEWANERLISTNSSVDLDSSISYPVYVPVEEVAREVVLELCKTYNWNPETGADNRLPKRNAGDATKPEVPISRNISQDIIVSGSPFSSGSNSITTSKVLPSTKHVKYHQLEILPDTIQQLATTTHEDIVNETFTVTRNTSLDKSKQSVAPNQRIYDNGIINKTITVRTNTSHITPAQLDTPDQVIHDNNTINKTYVVRKNISRNMPAQLDAPDQVIHGNSMQKFTAPERVTIFPVIDIISSLDEGTSCAAQNAGKNTCISSNGNYPDILHKDRVLNSEEHPENVEQKLHSSTPAKLTVNPALDTVLSSRTINNRQIPENNLGSNIPHMKSPKEKQISETLAIANSGPDSISSRNNVIITHRSGNIVNSCCAADNGSTTVSLPNETIVKTNIPKTNEIIRSSFPEASVNDRNMRGNMTTNLPQNMSTPNTVINNTTAQHFSYPDKKEENSLFFNTMLVNASRSDTPYRTLSEENRALIIELNEKLSRLQITSSPSQSIIRKSGNHHLISSMRTKHPEKYPLSVTGNPNPTIEDTMVILPKINNNAQTESNTHQTGSKNYANLGNNIDVIINSENMDQAINMIDGHFIANNQTQIIPNHVEDRCNKGQEFQMYVPYFSVCLFYVKTRLCLRVKAT
ncbi:hypothetical protein LOAG_03659 [Loa loa]|uniref:Uncharacterized protein n=1 Tax=Loa loa TaxID=7209 RepID=A0A1S0U3Z6_LOALO|nr:hypothetical protein LOAG_03659 [Loa loa]EFO24830.2 hypothetical protein LOAG_03659 [Loa loa]